MSLFLRPSTAFASTGFVASSYLVSATLLSVTQQLQTQAVEGALLTEAQFEALGGLLELFPDDRLGKAMGNMLRNELEAVQANDMVVSKNLPTILEYVRENLGTVFDEAPVGQAEVAVALRRHFGLSDAEGAPSSRISLHMSGRPTAQIQVLDRNNTPMTRLLCHEFNSGAVPPMPAHFFVSGYPVRNQADPRFPRVIQKVFGQPIPPDLLLRVFSLDAVNAALPPGVSPYVFDTLMIQKDREGIVYLNGLLKTQDDEYVGNFQIKIPPRTEGKKWIADGHDFNIDPHHRNRGLSSTLLRSFLILLLHLGVEALEARARESKASPENARSNSRYYYAKVGFNPDRQTLAAVTQKFLGYMDQRGLLTPNRRIEISHFTEIWQIADYVVDGDKVGKTFLSEVLDENLTMEFQIRGDYLGWLRVSPPRPPLEWDALKPETRQVLQDYFSHFHSIIEDSLLSDEKCGFHLADWVNNLSQQVVLHLESLERSKRRGSGEIPRMREMIDEMSFIADVMNMIADNDGQPLAYYFRKYLRPGHALTMVVEGIRERNIPLRFEVQS